MNNRFGHTAAELRFWRSLLQPLVKRERTPFYLFSAAPVSAALSELDAAFAGLPVRHWFSTKTQPLRPLLQWWRRTRGDIEVVSEFELQAALAEGYAPERILVNGPAKHHWLPRHARPDLRVNFDSLAEVQALATSAKKLNWSAGVRFLTAEEHDPESPDWPTQFGLAPHEALDGIRRLRRAGVRLETAHFHLRTNVASADCYARALAEIAAICRTARFAPRFVDCGGGFPPPRVQRKDGRPVDAKFRLGAMRRVCEAAVKQFPGAEEIWLENGRWLTARSGALIVRVLDVKERRGRRHLICDGGRTLNALVSNWEDHELIPLPARGGPAVPTTVTGPTCMAFDQLARRPLPRSLRAGDFLVWLEAGAYHLQWETRFSHGLAAVFWHEGRRIRRVRQRETFEQWWQGG
jgi:diaminopimelate decarboxylase